MNKSKELSQALERVEEFESLVKQKSDASTVFGIVGSIVIILLFVACASC